MDDIKKAPAQKAEANLIYLLEYYLINSIVSISNFNKDVIYD